MREALSSKQAEALQKLHNPQLRVKHTHSTACAAAGSPVVVRRPEGVLRHNPSRREDDKVGDSGAGDGGGCGEHSED